MGDCVCESARARTIFDTVGRDGEALAAAKRFQAKQIPRRGPAREKSGGVGNMHSEAYLEARKEFINCIVMAPIGLFVPLINAFREWRPIMKAELKKERAAQ